MLYFDHCATTPPHEEVTAAVGEVMQRYFGNPSSIHRIGLDAERLLERAREQIAGLFRTEKETIIFTSGGTESNNLAIIGSALQYRRRGNHIVTTEIEHPSVYECCRHLQRIGFEVTFVKPDAQGVVQAESVLDAVRDDTILVSVMHVNNEIGTIQPVRKIGEALKGRHRTLFHVDAVQSVGKLPVFPEQWGIDLLSVSAHKVRGPKGAGLLYKRKTIELQPVLFGGGQEQGLRSGTENVPAIVGMAKALRMAIERQEEASRHMYGLRGQLLERIADIPGIVLNGSLTDAAPHIVNLSLPGLKSEVIVHALEEYGIYLSTKSACSSGEDRPSRVLLAAGADPERASSGIRISFSPDHTAEDIEKLAEALRKTAVLLRRLQ